MNSLAEQIIVDIIRQEMDLPVANVWIRDQNRKVPQDQGVYVIVGMVDGKTISNVNTYPPVITDEFRITPETAIRAEATDGDERVDALGDTRVSASEDEDSRIDANGNTRIYPFEVLRQIQQLCNLENIQIDIVSRSIAAVNRRWEITAALGSLYSKRQQEENSFKIFRIPASFVNSSSADGGSNINRFSITVSSHVWYRKEKVLQSDGGDYYDDFTQRVDDEKSIGTQNGIVEFEISADSGVT